VWLVFRHQPLLNAHFTRVVGVPPPTTFDAHLIILQTPKMPCKREEEHPGCKQELLIVFACIEDFVGWRLQRPLVISLKK
jgi:hypothetical protein